jgi:hypothetical protein
MRNPASLGIVTGKGLSRANDNFPDWEERQVVQICFQLLTDSPAIVGYTDMDVSTGEGVLRYLFEAGEEYCVRLESGTRELILGDFSVFLPSEKAKVLVTAHT